MSVAKTVIVLESIVFRYFITCFTGYFYCYIKQVTSVCSYCCDNYSNSLTYTQPLITVILSLCNDGRC